MPAYYTPSQEYRDAQTASAKQLEATTSDAQSKMAANSAATKEMYNKEFNKKPEAYHVGQDEFFYLPLAGGQIKETNKNQAHYYNHTHQD